HPGAPRSLGRRRLLEVSRLGPARPRVDADLVCRAEHGVTAMRTPVCELLGIEQPIVLAPMAAVPRLAAAVSNAGALGMLTWMWSSRRAGRPAGTYGGPSRPCRWCPRWWTRWLRCR